LKRQSSTKPPLSNPSEWIFFTDRDLGKSIPIALRAAGFRVERHDDHFGPTTADEVWLPEVASRRWVAISHDKRIRRVGLQRDAAMRSGLALFLLIGKRHDELQRNLIPTMPRMIRFLQRHRPPFIAHVARPETRFPVGSRPGNVEMVLSAEAWHSRLGQ
jgi:hypothetical protein